MGIVGKYSGLFFLADVGSFIIKVYRAQVNELTYLLAVKIYKSGRYHNIQVV